MPSAYAGSALLVLSLSSACCLHASGHAVARSAPVRRAPDASLLLTPGVASDEATLLMLAEVDVLSNEEMQQFYVNAFVGGPVALMGGYFFRVINGREREGFESDPVVRLLGGPEKVRAGKRRLREEGMGVLFDPSLFR